MILVPSTHKKDSKPSSIPDRLLAGSWSNRGLHFLCLDDDPGIGLPALLSGKGLP